MTLVRATTRADLAGFRAIRLEALQLAPEAYGTRYEDVVHWTDEQWTPFLVAPTTFVAEADGEIVGMARGGHNDREVGETTNRWLWGMYVTPRVRGTGVALDLVEHVAQWSRVDGGERLLLHVRTIADRAQAFYRKAGFRETGYAFTHDERPDYHFIEMGRDL